MGYIAAYYLLGCVFKKHGDFRIFKLCLVTILPVSMLSYVIPGIFASYAPTLPLAATLTSGAVFILFILMSPPIPNTCFLPNGPMILRGGHGRGRAEDRAIGYVGRLRPVTARKRSRLVAFAGQSAKEIAKNWGSPSALSISTLKTSTKTQYWQSCRTVCPICFL